MAIRYIRSLTGRRRTPAANRHLGFALAFVAGAINAGGFLAVQQYTSHMTGIVSSMADNAVLGAYELVVRGGSALLSFMAGAACSAIMVNYSRRRRLHSAFALPLLLEAFLLICFGFLGARLAAVDGMIVSLTVMLLCFIMGLQNALITKVSKAEIRTTHVTGIVTDIGIELGKLFYCNGATPPGQPRVLANRARLKILAVLALSFFAGGVAGAYGFKHVGYIATVPLSLVLGVLAVVPALDDVRRYVRRAVRG
ncbi:YoaK family protein [Pseudomonas sp. Ps21-P2]|uniref:YoaK family protein n=1 Tax=Pseudomonas sp. Ps21-P2 TaxID=3080331 RepID=UPI00320B8815